MEDVSRECTRRTEMGSIFLMSTVVRREAREVWFACKPIHLQVDGSNEKLSRFFHDSGTTLVTQQIV